MTTLWLANSFVLLFAVHSYGSVSNSCSTLFLEAKPGKVLAWTYFTSIVHPNYKFSDLSSDTMAAYNIRLRGGITVKSPMVAYQRSTFSANLDVTKEVVYDDASISSVSFKETISLLNYLYDYIYSRNSTIEEIAMLRRIDQQLSPLHVGWIVFHPDNLYDPQAMIRIVDTAEKSNPWGFIAEKLPYQKLPIELEYPHLTLPERLNGNTAVELGRLGKTRNVNGDLKILLRAAANYIHQRFHGETDEITIYVEASPAAASLYVSKYGFKLAYDAKELGIPKNESQYSVLKIGAKDFITRYLSFNQHFFK